jgi:uncharacterized protein (DUF1501 family)
MNTRRHFLRQAGCAALTGIPILNTLLNLGLTGRLAAAAVPATGEYRALVCVMLSGGNDSFNVLIPRNAAGYADYVAARADLALAAEALLPITPLNTGGQPFGVHPAMPGLASLFEGGQAAFVANVGTLVERVANVAEVEQNLRRLPVGLYSHSDQIEQWHTSVPHQRSGIGWAGRMADLLRQLNTSQLVSMNISLDGSNIWQTGLDGAEYAADPGNDNDPASGGAVELAAYRRAYAENQNVLQAVSAGTDRQLERDYANLLQQAWQQKRRESLDAYDAYAAAMAATLPGGIVFPNTPLGRQLRTVARTIAGRSALGAVRQTFFCNLGGWDHHSDTLASQAGMLPQVDAAVKAFQDQMVALGMAEQVTLFSASDFGRTLTSNGQGSDHAWGGNQFVVGGAVKGRRIFGQFPSLKINPESGPVVNPLDTGRGRLIPTTSCDEFFAEMALWLGVPKTQLTAVFPNIGNFYSATSMTTTPPLGFLLDTV